MNGQFTTSVTACPSASLFKSQVPVSARLVKALIVSCLLHGAILVIPYLGSSIKGKQMAGREIPRTFTTTLISPTKASIATGNLSKLGKSDPDSPLPEHSPTAQPPPSQLRTEGANLLPMPASPYYTTDQLTKRPQPTGAADLDTPETSHIIASGKMILKLWINELGEVVNVEVEKTELPEVFSRSAIEAFKRLRFTAGERRGLRVGSVMRIEVSYDDGRLPPT